MPQYRMNGEEKECESCDQTHLGDFSESLQKSNNRYGVKLMFW